MEYAVVYLGLFAIAPVFLALEKWRPAVALVRTRAAWILDGLYWLLTPLFTGTFSRALVLGVVGALGFALGHGLDGFAFLTRLQAAMPFARLPWAAQFVLALLIADAIGYASHRLRHTRLLWNLHAVHHSAEELGRFVGPEIQRTCRPHRAQQPARHRLPRRAQPHQGRQRD